MIMIRKQFGIVIAMVLAMVICGCSSFSDEKDIPAPSPAPTPAVVVEPLVPEEAETEQEISEEVTEPDPERSFYIEEISDEVFSRMEGKSFPEECTTPREDLRYLHLMYVDIDGNSHEGEMVCNKVIAEKLVDIFKKLYEAGYPIERMTLIDDYDADDNASMSDNNTSCFNFRFVAGTTRLSNHASGLAVDLNPLYNPYIREKDGKTLIDPPEGEKYADRSKDFDYKIDEDDLAYKLFTEAGFEWGGAWTTKKDYQHFQYLQ